MREFIFDYIETNHFKLRILEAESYQIFLTSATEQEISYYTGIPQNEIKKEKNKGKYGFQSYNKSYLMFLIIDKKTDQIIGHCGYHTWYLEHDRAEIGYGLFNDSFKGKGVMTEVMQAVLHYGFDTMNLKRIEAFIGPENKASIRTVEKFGFIKEGQLRNHFVKNGIVEDSVVFSLLKEEYSSRLP